MADLVFRLVVSADGTKETFKHLKGDLEDIKKQVEDPSQLYVLTSDASGKMRMIQADAEQTKESVEKPMNVQVNATEALASMRDLAITIQGVASAYSALTAQINDYLNAALKDRQAAILTKVAFGEAANEMLEFASAMQAVTNFGDDDLTPLMARMAQTFHLSAEEVKAITPGILDFAEANKAAGMSVEQAYNLFGRALAGNTSMLSRFGVSLDETRLKIEGVSYLVEKLAEDYDGTAAALADLRTQNLNTWGDIKEEVGNFINEAITPLLQLTKYLMEGWQALPPVVKGVTAGLAIAVPVILSTAAAFVTLSAAVTALKAAINPVGAAISLVVGGLTVAAGAYGAYAVAAKEAADASDEFSESATNVNQAIQEAIASVDTEVEKFSLLAGRMLELRTAESLSLADKRQLQSIIATLNRDYGDLLGNINLEKASYEQLTIAINNTTNALRNKKMAGAFEQLYEDQAKIAAQAKVDFDKFVAEMKAKGDTSYLQSYTEMGLIHTELKWNYINALKDLNAIEAEWKTAIKDLPPLIPSAASTQPAIDALLEQAKRLADNLADYRRTETENLNIEYDKRKQLLINKLKKDSALQKQALEDLDAWKEAEQAKIDQRENDLQEQKFRDDIDYYSNLQALGVSSYDALKQTMEDYYAWAKENLHQREQELILAQLKETNLRWGLHQEEKRLKEEAHQRELQDIRDRFAKATLDLDGSTYDIRIMEIERYYERAKEKMIEAGIEEVEIEKQKQRAISAVRADAMERGASGISHIMANIASAQDKETKRGFKAWQAASIAQGYIDTFSAAISAYKSMVGIPVLGPGLAVAAAAAAMAAGLANVSRIAAMKYEPPRAATGGLIAGPSHSRGGVIIEAEGDEYITSKNRVKALGKQLFDFINFAPLEAVRNALAPISIPLVSAIPDGGGSYSFQSGGSVSQNSSALMSLLQKLSDRIDAPVQITVNVDPLSNDPVKISEITERGTIIRSQF